MLKSLLKGSGYEVASDADGLRDSVRDGETGLLFPYGDHEALADRVVRILSNSSLREKLTENAIAWSQSFTWDEAALKTMEIADRIIYGYGH